jgi:hypothetical protein
MPHSNATQRILPRTLLARAAAWKRTEIGKKHPKSITRTLRGLSRENPAPCEPLTPISHGGYWMNKVGRRK